MTPSKGAVRSQSVFFISILFFIIFIPNTAHGLCINAEACGILGGTLLSMVTVPLCLILLIFGFWKKTRQLLQVFALLPGFMSLLTGYLIVIQGNRFDLLFIPLIHILIAILMIGLGRLDTLNGTKNIEL